LINISGKVYGKLGHFVKAILMTKKSYIRNIDRMKHKFIF